jgi:hypothetical protein
MSDTVSFITRGGAKNGLPICIPEIDVSNFEFVNAMSLKQVSNIFYNLEAISIPLETPDDPETAGDSSVPGFQIEQTYNNYDEIVKFSEISDPAVDPGVSVVPFSIGTQHFEEANPVYGGFGIIDVDYVLDDSSNYEIAEPYNKTYRCGLQNQPSTYRAKFSSDQISSVVVSCDFNQFYRLYTKESPTSPKVYEGYGFAMGAITMFAGIIDVNGNQISYGNFANDLDYKPSSPSAPPNWWSAHPGFLLLGQSLVAEAEPDLVTFVTLDFLGSPFNADFIQASWTGRDSSFPASWFVPPLVGECLIPYEYI